MMSADENYAQGIEALIATLASQLSEAGSGQDAEPAVAREKAVRLLAEMVGALVLSQGVASTNPSLSDEILRATGRR